MKNILVAIFCMSASWSIFVMGVETRETIMVDKPTFDFVLLVRGFYRIDENLDDYYRYLIKSFLSVNHCLLNKIDGRLSIIDKLNFDNNMDLLKDVLLGKNIYIQDGSRKLALGASFLTNQVEMKTVVFTRSGNCDQNDQKKTDKSSLIIKASGAAAVTGLATYYAIGCYNKDKSKERQLSKLKWSLGVALVVGAGTYWYVR